MHFHNNINFVALATKNVVGGSSPNKQHLPCIVLVITDITGAQSKIGKQDVIEVTETVDPVM